MRQAFPPPSPNSWSKCHQTITTPIDATVVKKNNNNNRGHASPQKRHEGREGFLEEVWCKPKSNGKVEARQQACF